MTKILECFWKESVITKNKRQWCYQSYANKIVHIFAMLYESFKPYINPLKKVINDLKCKQCF